MNLILKNYVINIRYVNYQVDQKNGSYVFQKNKTLYTENMCLILDQILDYKEDLL